MESREPRKSKQAKEVRKLAQVKSVVNVTGAMEMGHDVGGENAH